MRLAHLEDEDNYPRSGRGIVHGVHFQIGDGAAKLVRCGCGPIVDVMVVIHRGSPTFGAWDAFHLDEDNMRSVYCPVGFAHGFCVLSDVADVLCKESNYCTDATQREIADNHPDVAVERAPCVVTDSCSCSPAKDHRADGPPDLGLRADASPVLT